MTLDPNHIHRKCEIVLVNAHDDFFLSYLPNYGFMLDRNTLYSAVQYLWLISAYFQSFMHRKMVFPYWRFGKTYQSDLQVFISLMSLVFLDCIALEDVTNRLPETSIRKYNSTLRIIPKNADFIYIATESWNHAEVWLAVCQNSVPSSLMLGL
jgi:hypothetical protein